MWSEMFPEILEDISDRLPFPDYAKFRAVCRKWRSSPSGRSEISSFSKKRPWLLCYGFDRKYSGVSEDTCYLYSWSHPNPCAIRLPHLRGTTIMHSKGCWLFVRRNDDDGCFFLFNPFTLTKIDLPNHVVVGDQVCTMTTPTAANYYNCTAYIVSRTTDLHLEICWCRIGDTEWKNHRRFISKDRIGTMCVAYVCDDSHVEKSTIHIGGSKRFLSYDYSKVRLDEWLSPHGIAESSLRAQEGKLDLMSQVHHENWLERFGEKGIFISTCARMRIGGSFGISQRCTSIAGKGKSTVEYKMVRAAWIEPRFV